jgi:hypothetical protein
MLRLLPLPLPLPLLRARVDARTQPHSPRGSWRSNTGIDSFQNMLPAMGWLALIAFSTDAYVLLYTGSRRRSTAAAVCWLGSSFLPNSSNITGLVPVDRLRPAAMCDWIHLSRKAGIRSCDSIPVGARARVCVCVCGGGTAVAAMGGRRMRACKWCGCAGVCARGVCALPACSTKRNSLSNNCRPA